MSAVTVTVESITDIVPCTHVHALELQVFVTDQQRRDIALTMIGGMGSEDAYNWARKEFPDWFAEVQA